MMLRHFTQHPADAGQSYIQHMGFALRVAGLLGWAALAAIIHALLPFVFQTTASRIIAGLHAEITGKACEPDQG